MPDTIIYEQPLNERIRIFLRLEFLFNRVDLALEGDSILDDQDAVDALLNIVSVFDRSDLKSEIIKEIERIATNLAALENIPGVDNQMLGDLLAEIDQTMDALLVNKSAIGQQLRENDFLYGIRQRSSIPGGTCGFDIPAYHFWLQHVSKESRKQQLSDWLAQFTAARTAIEITLRLIRESTTFNQHHAEAGFYQQNLDSNQPNQLIRVKLPKSVEYYPEISGGKHRFTIRFMHFDITQRSQQIGDNVEFSISCCAM